jgi:hypothetical protein
LEIVLIALFAMGIAAVLYAVTVWAAPLIMRMAL